VPILAVRQLIQYHEQKQYWHRAATNSTKQKEHNYCTDVYVKVQ